MLCRKGDESETPLLANLRIPKQTFVFALLVVENDGDVSQNFTLQSIATLCAPDIRDFFQIFFKRKLFVGIPGLDMFGP